MKILGYTGFILGLLFPVTVHASCWDNCANECNLFAGGTDAGMCTSRCAANCTPASALDAPVNVHVPQYGAIAISNTTMENAYSYNYPTQSEAEQKALDICRNSAGRPQDCEIAVWFYDACGALAINGDRAWGANWKNTQAEAEQSALALCGDSGQQGCEVVISYCSR